MGLNESMTGILRRMWSALGIGLCHLRGIRRGSLGFTGSKDQPLSLRPSLTSCQIKTLITSFALYSFLVVLLVRPADAQESPYIVTYDHYLEEPGSLEIEYFSTFGTQHGGNDFMPPGSSLNTAPRHGGRPSSTSTGRRLSTTAPFSPAFAGRTVSACSSKSIL
jgi:hypothetical protein